MNRSSRHPMWSRGAAAKARCSWAPLLILLVLASLAAAQDSRPWRDCNRDGVRDAYEDPTLAPERRIDDLLRRMTVDEKTCQMATLYGFGAVLKDQLPTDAWSSEIWKDGIANIDEHLNGFRKETPHDWPPSAHARAINAVQRWFAEKTRLGIPVDFTNEGIRGLSAAQSTCFPNQLGMGATWDRALVRRQGEIVGAEARAFGFTNVYAPILDVARDQRWGRFEETYGEDPFLVAELGIEMTRGMQSRRCVSTPKHFAVYSASKGAREDYSRTDPQVSPHEVENVLVYPFRRVFSEAGALGVMSSYNDYAGTPITGSRHWLTDRLRGEFGFEGYVVSDSDAVEYIHSKHHVAKDYREAVKQAVLAGLNVRTTFTPPQDFIRPLRDLVATGEVPMAILDARVRDVLRVKFWLGLFDDPYVVDPAASDAVVRSADHLAIARRAAGESLTLLKNESARLPLDLKHVKRIAVIGPNAKDESLARKQYGPNRMPVTTVFDAIAARVGEKAAVVHEKGCDAVDANFPESEVLPVPLDAGEVAAIESAVAAARGADVAVLVLGDSVRTTGESHSRTSLDLPGRQEVLLERVYATGTPVVLVLMSGRPVTINFAHKHVPAILAAWLPGAEGGAAIASVLFGDEDASGRSPCTWIRTVGQIPYNFPTKPAANFDPMRKYTAHVGGVLWPFGHGLSYTTFDFSDLSIEPRTPAPDQSVTVEFSVRNTGARDGVAVPQLYVRDLVSSVTTYEQCLRGFDRLHLAPGESRRVTFTLAPAHLEVIGPDGHRAVEPGEFEVQIGASSADIRLKGKFESVVH